MELPARCRPPRSINLVEPIPEVHTQRSQRGQRSDSKARTPEQPRRVELARLVPNVAAVEESVQVERTGSFGDRARPVPTKNALPNEDTLRLSLVGVGVEAVRRDRELLVAAQLLAVLRRHRARTTGRSKNGPGFPNTAPARAESPTTNAIGSDPSDFLRSAPTGAYDAQLRRCSAGTPRYHRAVHR